MIKNITIEEIKFSNLSKEFKNYFHNNQIKT